MQDIRVLVLLVAEDEQSGPLQQLLPLNRSFIANLAEDSGQLKFTISKFYRVAGGTTQKQGVSPDIVRPTPYDYMEIGEATLPNSLAADHTDPLNYRKLNRVNDYVKRLTTRSDARIKDDQDFAYILEDIKTLKERLLDKSLSLNETTRLKEKDDEKEKRETRKKRK